MADSVQYQGSAAKVGPENPDRLRIEINGGEASESRPLEAEGEATAAAKEIKESRGVVHGELKVGKSFT